MRIALAQLDLLIGDVDAAVRSLAQAAASAHAQGADMLIAPELAMIGGYPPRDLLDRRALVEAQWRALEALARTLPLPALIGCVEPLADGPDPRLANALAVCEGGRLRAVYHKRLLPIYDVFDERRYFRPGTTSQVIPIAGVRVGLTVCEDIWNEAGFAYGVDPVAELAGRCDLLVNVSASPYHVGKPLVRQQLVAALAKRVGAPAAYCNQVGAHDELLFDGGSCVVSPDGTHHLHAPRWSAGLFIADTSACRRPGRARSRRRSACRAGGGHRRLLRQDPAAARGARTLGRHRFRAGGRPRGRRAGRWRGDRAAHARGRSPAAARSSTPKRLADRLGIETHTLSISRPFEVMLAELEPVFAGTARALAEENLQSRLRGTLVMAVANKRAAMALTTGNKSRLAVGYCTIYGDMNGGLAPIGDCYKTQVWALSRWLNRDGERIPEASISKGGALGGPAREPDRPGLAAPVR